ncbi:MAG: nuclear transport factor 2 family protein [Solirubrobacterales bacterium]|nr:nuclear transport factor 2 family protein [Solirubrobacterales bacterium]HMT04703.1 nuclear transport factor 2 family protein [Solirubrobacterales bacterium]
MTQNEKAVREFISTFNRSELDSFVQLLDPEVEIHGMRGLKKGREQARSWATKKPGGVQQTVSIDSFQEAKDRVLARVKREWRWEEGNELAYVDELVWLFEMKNGLIASWQPFHDPEEAKAAFSV